MAASGGRDSTALLHATVRAARGTPVQVHAMHVHHGLHPDADGWLVALQRQCRRWGVVLQVRHLRTRAAPGQSVEAWARRERYAALAAMAGEAGCTLVLLAHHRRDQAETWLLQALRGGGPAGLSAMPKEQLRENITWARPWLNAPREAIDAYVRRHRLSHVDDGSNAEVRFARNRLRVQVWPALTAAFPDAEASLAASAVQAQQAAALAAEVAALDLATLCADDGRLQTLAWRVLPPARRRNALAAWLARCSAGGVSTRLLDRLMQELPVCVTARWPVPGGELRLYRGMLSMDEGAASEKAKTREPPVAPLPIDLSLAVDTRVPFWQGCLHVEPTPHDGVASSMLAHLVARPRCGGERFRLDALAPARSLKLQYQARGVPAWERQGPLLYTAGGRLLWVPGLGVDAALRAPHSVPQWHILWRSDTGDAEQRRVSTSAEADHGPGC
ncbi:MAG: tRNA lysidine(34) synthetase TilS [Rubrivivax sp.]